MKKGCFKIGLITLSFLILSLGCLILFCLNFGTIGRVTHKIYLGKIITKNKIFKTKLPESYPSGLLFYYDIKKEKKKNYELFVTTKIKRKDKILFNKKLYYNYDRIKKIEKKNKGVIHDEGTFFIYFESEVFFWKTYEDTILSVKIEQNHPKVYNVWFHMLHDGLWKMKKYPQSRNFLYSDGSRIPHDKIKELQYPK